MMLPLENITCICGKRLGNETDHAICAACGLVTDLERRLPAPPPVTTNGNYKETAPIIKTTMKNLPKSICVASYSKILRTFIEHESVNGN